MAALITHNGGKEGAGVSLFAWRPRELDQAMIRPQQRVRNRTQPIFDNRAAISTEACHLDQLPTEIHHMIFNLLDLQSLVRLSQVSSHMWMFVNSLPAYQELEKYAPSVMTVLARTLSLSLYSVSHIQKVLRSDQCVYCENYGAFLFLSTCMRCCWECLTMHPSFRLITQREAIKSFALKQVDVEKLPTFRSIPSFYAFRPVKQEASLEKPLSLVSAVAARELGIATHGSAQNADTHISRRLEAIKSLATSRYLQGACIHPAKREPLEAPWAGEVPPDRYFGMGSMPFPSLKGPSQGEVEYGTWCKGCNHAFHLYQERVLDSSILKNIIPPGCDPFRILLGRARKAIAKVDFQEHINHYYSTKALTERAQNGSRGDVNRPQHP